MAATQVNIVNMALRSIGVARITALSDDSEQARVMTDLYEHIRDEMISLHPWNFAIEYSDTLAENVDTPDFDYDYSYALPAGCLRVIELEDAEDEFKVVGGNLFTDTQDPKIKYIKQVTTTSNFSKSFVTAFAARLAAEACFTLTNDKVFTEQKFEEYKLKLQQSKVCDAQEGTFEKLENSSWIDDRE
jgi:hypothetical protein